MDFKNSVVVYYRPGCPYCDAIKPSFPDFESSLLKQNIGFNAVNTLDDTPTIEISGVPTIVYFDKDGNHTKFTDRRTVEQLTSWAVTQKNDTSNNSMPPSDQMILTLYHMPTCGYCTQFMPTFDSLNIDNCTMNKVNIQTQLGQDQVNLLQKPLHGVPHLVATFGEKQHVYSGDRSVGHITQWVNSLRDQTDSLEGGYIAPLTDIDFRLNAGACSDGCSDEESYDSDFSASEFDWETLYNKLAGGQTEETLDTSSKSTKITFYFNDIETYAKTLGTIDEWEILFSAGDIHCILTKNQFENNIVIEDTYGNSIPYTGEVTTSDIIQFIQTF